MHMAEHHRSRELPLGAGAGGWQLASAPFETTQMQNSTLLPALFRRLDLKMESKVFHRYPPPPPNPGTEDAKGVRGPFQKGRWSAFRGNKIKQNAFSQGGIRELPAPLPSGFRVTAIRP